MGHTDFSNKTILAPMMMGSNRTFRRIVHQFGADILGGEMAHSAKLRKEDRREVALVSARHEAGTFSAQICGCNIEHLVEAAKVVEGRGAQILDLNAGCPMHFVTQRGSGAALLESRSRMARIVEALRQNVSLPVTVKIRAGFAARRGSQVAKIAKALEDAGASAIAVHARFRDEFYETPANWSYIREAVDTVKIPVIGNGDIRTFEDVARMRQETGCSSVMVGRAALQRPWIFQEIAEGKAIHPSQEERWTWISEHSIAIREAFGERAGFKLFRWHCGWYMRWHVDQRVLRDRWDTYDETKWDELLREVQEAVLTGPRELPVPILKHDLQEAG